MEKLTKMMTYVASISILIILVSACLSTGAQRSYKRYVAYLPYDAIIVPGVPFENGTWSEIMKMRVHWATHLYKTGITKNIVFSGSSVYSPYVESRIMALYAEELGVSKDNIYTEERAEHSSENLYYSYTLAKKEGFEKIALATDPFQGSFLRGFAHKIKLDDIGFLPIVFDTLQTMELTTPEIDPTWAYVEDFVALPERENQGKRFLGTMGKFIEYDEGDHPNEKKRKK